MLRLARLARDRLRCDQTASTGLSSGRLWREPVGGQPVPGGDQFRGTGRCASGGQLPRHPVVRHSGGTLALLGTGLSDLEIARKRHLSARTIEDHKRRILEIFGTSMEARHQGFAGLSRDLGIRPGDLVNDCAGQRPARA
jgi:hypothetical protein